MVPTAASSKNRRSHGRRSITEQFLRSSDYTLAVPDDRAISLENTIYDINYHTWP
jgi:hypothetical protein